MTAALQYLLSGLAIGGIYALVALGFHLMWTVAKAVNFAQGDTLMIGALLTLVALDSGVSMWVAVPLAVAAAAVFGAVLERLAMRPFAANASSIGWMLTTIAVGMMVESLATMHLGGFSRALPSPGVERSVSIMGVGIYPQELLIPVVAVAIMVGLTVLQRYTMIGRSMRAVARDRDGAALMGINVNKIIAFSFALAAALGAGAGILVAPVIQVSATMGLLLGLKGFAVAIIGGITSAGGVVLAGFAYGIIEKTVEGVASTAAREIVGFGLMIVVLLIFPQGLFGKREVFKV